MNADTKSNRTLYRHASADVVGTYDAQDRLLTFGSTSYAYTANGDLEIKSQGGYSVTYSYDEFRNLRSAALAEGIGLSYLVEGHHRRIGKAVNGTLVKGFLSKTRAKWSPSSMVRAASWAVSCMALLRTRRSTSCGAARRIAFSAITSVAPAW